MRNKIIIGGGIAFLAYIFGTRGAKQNRAAEGSSRKTSRLLLALPLIGQVLKHRKRA